MFAHRHGHQDRKFFSNLCTNHHVRGRAVCKKGLEAHMVNADAAALHAVEHDLLHVEIMETALHKAMEMIRPRGNGDREREHDKLRDELGRLDGEVGRLAGAIAAGGDLPALVAALQEREHRRVQSRAELGRLERLRAAEAFDAERVLGDLRERLTDWQGLLRQETGPARQALRALLAGRLIFEPQERDGERFYRFEGADTVSPIIAGIAAGALPTALASPP